MKCPLCNTEAIIVSSKYIVEGDTNENEETKLFIAPQKYIESDDEKIYEKAEDKKKRENKYVQLQV